MNMKKIILCAMLTLGVSFASHSQQKLYVIKDGAISHTIPLSEIGYITTGIGYEYVDLGLSVKWATCNVGASAPEELGNYYAWGETQPKELYTPATCATHKVNLTQTNVKGNAQYDAATANWGSTWRLPTSAEADELVNNCTWTWDATNKGYKVTGTNGNSIFLPAAGVKSHDTVQSAGSVGEYWTATPHEVSAGVTNQKMAHFFLFYYNKDHDPAGDENKDRIFLYRSDGRSIRPVCD